jgi:uncharacterized protein (DUF342 family)
MTLLDLHGKNDSNLRVWVNDVQADNPDAVQVSRTPHKSSHPEDEVLLTWEEAKLVGKALMAAVAARKEIVGVTGG